MADETNDQTASEVVPVTDTPVEKPTVVPVSDTAPSDDNIVEPEADDAKADEEVANPKAYRAPHDVYVSGIYTKAGDPFVTNAEPEESWVVIEEDALPAVMASTQEVPGDVALENLDVAALQAIAATKHVNITGIEDDHDALVTAIKAAQEPSL